MTQKSTTPAFMAIDAQHAQNEFDRAKGFFHATPPIFANFASAAPAPTPTPDSYASDQGMVQFHLIGQKPDDPAYSALMNENMDILMGMGGLVNDYMTKTYPKVNATKLDINTWKEVTSHIPDLALGKNESKSFSDTFTGVKISGEFLMLVAKAIITEGGSLLTDFQSYLQKMGDLVFSVHTQDQTYKVLTCTYMSYLLENGVGGYYDYGAMVLREINFKSHFMDFKGVCVSAQNVVVDMQYTEYTQLVQLRRLRQGGDDHDKWTNLINPNSTAQFESASNFFNGGNTPQNQIKPGV
jgi:hypothetical protein